MKKKGLLIVFSIIILFTLGFASAKNITLNYPSEVNYGEIFNIELDLIDFAENLYDVKIDITTSEGKRISKILNKGEWKTTYNYVLDAIDSSADTQKVFSLNITEPYTGTANIEVKIRNSVVNSFSGYEIHVSQENSEENKNNREAESNNQTEENTNNPNNNENTEPEISLDIGWNKEDIINGEEFNIELKAYDLKNENYDAKVWIEFKENSTVISDRYDEDADEWKSGTYYINDFFTGSGDKTKEITLRIRENFIDFDGNANLFFKLRNIDKEVEKTIKILPTEENPEEIVETAAEESAEESSDEEIVEKVSATQEKEIIRLGTRKSENGGGSAITGNMLYESSSEKIKNYGIYALVIVLSLIIIFLIKKKL